MIKHTLSRAVTLIEMIIAITLVGIVAGILGTIMHQTTNTYLIAQNTDEISWQARLALFRLERELGDAISINSTNAGSLVFTSGQDGSTVTYTKTNNGTTLTRNNVSLVQHVSALSFGYLGSTFVSTNQSNNVRCITISLTISYENQTAPLSTTVCPRNLAWNA